MNESIFGFIKKFKKSLFFRVTDWDVQIKVVAASFLFNLVDDVVFERGRIIVT